MTENGNGYPKVDLYQLEDLWDLGNLALKWAQQPLGIDHGDLERFEVLCARYGLSGPQVHYAFQKKAFPELALRQRDQIEQRPSPSPRGGTDQPMIVEDAEFEMVEDGK